MVSPQKHLVEASLLHVAGCGFGTPQRHERGPDSGAIRLGIQLAAWKAVDDGSADTYTGLDFAQFTEGELVLIAGRAMSELERNVEEDRR